MFVYIWGPDDRDLFFIIMWRLFREKEREERERKVCVCHVCVFEGQGILFFIIMHLEEETKTQNKNETANLIYCISHYFRVQLFSRSWTRCGNSRVVNFAIFLMLSLL